MFCAQAFFRRPPAPWLLAQSRILQQPLPLDGLGEDLPLQPHLVAVVEVLRQVYALAQNALQAVVHRRKVAVAALVIATAVKLLDALAQGALLCLEVPGTCINVCGRGCGGQLFASISCERRQLLKSPSSLFSRCYGNSVASAGGCWCELYPLIKQ